MLDKIIMDKMEDIVENCMGDSQSPCVATCPMHTDVKGYVNLIAEGKGEEAIKLIREKLFMPGVLGRICAHPCEGKCKWSEANSPMAIASLKRYAADNFDREELWDLSKKDDNGKKVAIIGAGPSGCQAALDLRREGFAVTVFEKLPYRGGMMRVGIPEYRLPRDVIERDFRYLDKLGVKFKLNMEVGRDIQFEDIKNEYDAVIVAVGKHVGRVDRSLDNCDAKGIFSAAEFLKEAALTRDIENCGKNVVVVGGGDVAMDCCRVGIRINGVESVQSFCLEDSFEKMAASEHEIKGCLEEGINFNHATAIKKILVDDNGRVKVVETKKCISMFDENGNFAPKFDENDTKFIKADTIVFAIGQGVDATFANGSLKQAKNTAFQCDPLTLRGEDEKVFFAGDASGQSVIVIQAMATGRRAAESVTRYLNGEDIKEGRTIESTSSYETKLKTNVNWEEFKNLTRQTMKCSDPKEGTKFFQEVSLGFSKEEAEKEASRCHQCECKLCMKECLMLNEYTDCPKTLFKEYLEKGYTNMDKLIAYSCNECSQCTIQCPKDFDIKEIFMAIKRDFAEQNKGNSPLECHKEIDKAQEMECSDEYSTAVNAKKKKTKYVFVPGCTVPAYNPEAVEKIFLHLQESLDGEVGTILQCCGKVTKMIGEQDKFKERYIKVQKVIDVMDADVIVTICPSCYMVYKENSNKEVISYWDLMKEKIGIPKECIGIGEESNVKFNVHDPCATRNITSHHESIRWMLEQMGYKYEEMNHYGTNTRCCGVGGLSCTANPDLYEKLMNRRADDCTQEQVVTYCGSCRGTMEAAGKDALHILDLMFANKTYMKEERKKRAVSDIWKNRLECKERLNKYK